MAQIWTVEDEEHIAVLIVDILTSMGHQSRRFIEIEEVEKARRQGELPDLMLLDIMLRGKSGFDLLRRWKQDPESKRVPVIILSARSMEMDKVRGLDLSTEDYITKPFSIRELKARINTALRRLNPQAQQLVHGPLVLEPENRGLTLDGEPVQLTQQEYALLHYMVRHTGKLLSRAQLLKDVWGYEHQTEVSRTVDYHIRALRKKLNDDAHNPRLIQTVHGGGYRMMDQDG